MHKHELLEFYQLIKLYQTTYKDDSLNELLKNVESLYEEIAHTDIKKQSNPRQAGRKSKYTEEWCFSKKYSKGNRIFTRTYSNCD